MPTDNDEVTRYIEGLPSPQREIAARLRQVIGFAFPDLREEFKWSRPVYSTKSGAVAYMVANKSDVNFGFDLGSKLEDPKSLLRGTGINKRHLKIKRPEKLDEEYSKRLLRDAISLAEPQRSGRQP